jgi:hypothetical protein
MRRVMIAEGRKTVVDLSLDGGMYELWTPDQKAGKSVCTKWVNMLFGLFACSRLEAFPKSIIRYHIETLPISGPCDLRRYRTGRSFTAVYRVSVSRCHHVWTGRKVAGRPAGYYTTYKLVVHTRGRGRAYAQLNVSHARRLFGKQNLPLMNDVRQFVLRTWSA